MKDRQQRKVVIIHDIDSENIEKAILILRNGGVVAPAPANYQIVTEAEKIIRSYSRTVDKSQKGLDKKETRRKRRETTANTMVAMGIGLTALLSISLGGYLVLSLLQFLIEKF